MLEDLRFAPASTRQRGVSKGTAHVATLISQIEGPNCSLLESARAIFWVLTALAPPIETFATGRDFAAWLGLTPLPKSSGGKQRLGAISKMGERTMRRLLIIGASAVVSHACRRGAPEGSWLVRMLVTVALANKMARVVWALLVKDEAHRAPVVVA